MNSKMKKYIVYDGKVYEIKINEEYKKNGIVNHYYIQTSFNVRLLFTRNELKEYKQADTIEELFDQFVIIDNNGKHHVFDPFDLKTWKTDNQLFAATWTDKGLIYVAKLNDKGELELI